jgi:hypothetical protein
LSTHFHHHDLTHNTKFLDHRRHFDNCWHLDNCRSVSSQCLLRAVQRVPSGVLVDGAASSHSHYSIHLPAFFIETVVSQQCGPLHPSVSLNRGAQILPMASLKRKISQDARRAPAFKPPRRVESRLNDTNTSLSDESFCRQEPSAVHRKKTNAATSARPRPTSSPVSSDLDHTMEDAESGEETADPDSTTHLRRRESAASRRQSNKGQGTVQDAAAILQDDPNEHSISRALITRILFSGFQDKNTKIGKEALGIVEMYMRLFVKESIARTCQEAKNKNGASLADLDDNWLQVEDLEKIAPQLILDF